MLCASKIRNMIDVNILKGQMYFPDSSHNSMQFALIKFVENYYLINEPSLTGPSLSFGNESASDIT